MNAKLKSMVRSILLISAGLIVGVLVTKQSQLPLPGNLPELFDPVMIGLNGRYRDVRLPECTREEAIQRIMEIFGVPIRLLLAPEGDDFAEIKLKPFLAEHVDLESALSLILMSDDGYSTIGTFDVQGREIVVSNQRNARPITCIYNVEPLYSLFRIDPNLGPRYRYNNSGNVVEINYEQPSIEEMLDYIKKLIQDNCDTTSWKDNGGEIGSISSIQPGLLIVTATARCHQKARALLNQISNPEKILSPSPSTTRPSDNSTRALAAKLRETYRDLTLPVCTPREACKKLAETYGVAVHLQMGRDPSSDERTVGAIELKHERFDSAVDKIFEFHDIQPYDLSNNAVVFRAKLDNVAVSRIYDVAPIIDKLYAQHSAEPMLRDAIRDNIIAVLRETVAPKSWYESGGSLGMIQSFSTQTIAVTTLARYQFDVEWVLHSMLTDLGSKNLAKFSTTQPTTLPR